MTDRFLPPGQLCWMPDGRCVGEFPQNIIGDQRLPLRVVVDERLDMSLQEVGSDGHLALLVASGALHNTCSPSDCGIKMPGAIDARKAGRSIDGPLGRITPDPCGYVLLSRIVGGWSATLPKVYSSKP